jgi:Trypsin-like peptidase domain
MFQEAYEIASAFTQPVIYLWKTVAGVCRGGIGSCVVINDDGWVLTAAHIVTEAANLAKADHDARAWEASRDALKADASISAKERGRRFAALGTPKAQMVRRAAVRWGHHASTLRDVTVINDVDIAVGKLDPFDPSWVTQYPIFKDPTKSFLPGASLCKLGFPFMEIKPTFDEATGIFDIPPDARNPLKFVETSTPGLKGQSGGPTFDTKGSIWAIQARTAHHPLDFSPEIKDGGKIQKEHQFLNVGWGVHVETVLGLLQQVGVKHAVSAY